jgi:cell division septation protein DedD
LVEKSPDLASYTAGTTVKLTARPVPGYVFCGWSGALTGYASPAALIMSSNLTVNAVFVQKATPTPLPSAPSPPPATGTGSGTDVTIVIINLSVSLTQQGDVIDDVAVVGSDHNIWLNIPKGTVCKDQNGNSLTTISIEKLTVAQRGIPPDNIFGAVYMISPDNASFYPAAVLFLRYDPSAVPQGTLEDDIVIVWWDSDAGKWAALSTVVDTENNVAYTLLTHTSIFSGSTRVSFAAAAATTTTTTTAVVTAAAAQPSPTPSATSPAITAAPAVTGTPAASETEEAAEGSDWGIVLIAVGGLLFLAVVIVMVIVYRSRKDHYNPPKPDNPPDDVNPSGGRDDNDNDEE